MLVRRLCLALALAALLVPGCCRHRFFCRRCCAPCCCEPTPCCPTGCCGAPGCCAP